MSSVNASDVNRGTTASDMLSNVRQLVQSQISVNILSNTNLKYIFGLVETPKVTDLSSLSKQTASNSATVATSVSQTSQNTGSFLVGTAKVGFSDAG
jgi:hypothetical protein